MEKDTTWEWTDSAVEMIPFGLLAGFYGEKEIRISNCIRNSQITGKTASLLL